MFLLNFLCLIFFTNRLRICLQYDDAVLLLFFPMCLHSHMETEDDWTGRLRFYRSETYSHPNMLYSVHGQSELLYLFKGYLSHLHI